MRFSAVYFRLISFFAMSSFIRTIERTCHERCVPGKGSMEAGHYDLAVIGGGVNGCGIARDAAGRGLSGYLCEQHDLARGTSARSTKLIPGGLRDLAHPQFGLLRRAP